MKVKLTPELSYIIGLWKEARTSAGIGVGGREELLSVFSDACLKAKVAEAGKILSGENSVYFYHTAYRKFFQKVVEEEAERFKYKNEYSANFLAGLFDAVGEIGKDGTVCFSRCTRTDEMVLYRLGFNTVRKAGKIYVVRPLKFLAYIKPFTKLFVENEVMKKVL
ncbi:MAG: hypothetical protein AB1657_00250 [Candidatus Micrarchaeota archaeon]